MFKSTGPNGRHPRVLNELAEVITEPLAIIFEHSWRTDEVPEDWKRAHLEPSFKRETDGDPGNTHQLNFWLGKILE